MVEATPASPGLHKSASGRRPPVVDETVKRSGDDELVAFLRTSAPFWHPMLKPAGWRGTGVPLRQPGACAVLVNSCSWSACALMLLVRVPLVVLCVVLALVWLLLCELIGCMLPECTAGVMWAARGYGTRVCARVCLLCCGVWWVTQTGKRDPAAHTLVMNHVSWLDPAISAAVAAPITFVAKESVKKVPIIGYVARLLRVVFVKRVGLGRRTASVDSPRNGSPVVGAKTDADVPEAAAERDVEAAGSPPGRGGASAVQQRQRELARRAEMGGLKRMPDLLIFPEGTTTNGTCLASFRRGAFIAGTRVQPVTLRFNLGRRDAPSATWESVPMSTAIWEVLGRWRTSVRVDFLAAMEPASDAERREPALFAASVRRSMAASMGVPEVNVHSLNVKRELHRRIRAGEFDWRWWAPACDAAREALSRAERRPDAAPWELHARRGADVDSESDDSAARGAPAEASRV